MLFNLINKTLYHWNWPIFNLRTHFFRRVNFLQDEISIKLFLLHTTLWDFSFVKPGMKGKRLCPSLVENIIFISIVKMNNYEFCEEVVFIEINTNNDTIKVAEWTPCRTQMDHRDLFFLAKEDCRIGEDVQKEVFDRLRNTDAGTRDIRV